MHNVKMIARLATVILLSGSLFAFAAELKQPAEVKEPHGEMARSEGPTVALKVPLLSPLFSSVPIALVNDEPIVMRSLTSALETAHEGKQAGAKTEAAATDVSEILNRLITVRLIVQEAREMGMDDLSEVKNAVEENKKTTARALLIEDITKDVTVDEAEVEKFRREMVREWKIKSVLFEKEEDANKMEEELKAGKGFDEVASKAIEDKKATGQVEGAYVRANDLLPDVVAIVSKMEAGSVSPVIKVGSGKETEYTIVKLVEIWYPTDPRTFEKARGAVLDVAMIDAVKKFKRDAYKKLVKVNKKAMDSLDYEAKKPGFQKMLKDKTTVASVKGEKPVTVADLSRAMSEKFFHGMDRAIEGKQVNSKKYEMLDGILEKKVFEKESKNRGIEKSEKFVRKMKEYEDSLVFNQFVKKVLIPDVKANEADMKAYHAEHAADYTTPEMMKVAGLVFETLELAEAALDRLKKGADFNWMKSNAEGQVDKSDPDLIPFTGKTVATLYFPQGVQRVLSGAKENEYRLYESPQKHFYVLYVMAVVPSSIEPYEEVRQQIAKKIFNRKLNASVEDWADKLRDSADVKIYLASPAATGEKSGKQ